MLYGAKLFLMTALVIAHRGASGEAPENTLAAFQRAIEANVDFVELDIHFSRDGEMMVIHDQTVDRTTSGQGKVSDLTRQEIQALDAGSWFSGEFRGEKVPTLEEVVELVKPTSVGLLIEIKKGSGLPQGFEERLTETIRRHELQSRVMIQSFDHDAVGAVKKADTSLAVAVLMDYSSPDPGSEARAVGAGTLALKSNLVTKEVVEQAHRSGLRLFVWTVNGVIDMRKMLTLGVDGIITDYPKRLHQTMDE